jgi:hypothetical protein
MGVPLRDFVFGRDSLDGRLHYPRFGHYRFAQIPVIPRHVASRSNRPTDRVEWLGFALLAARIVLECTAALRGNKACQGEVVQSNIGEAGNRTTTEVARPAIPPRGLRDWRSFNTVLAYRDPTQEDKP